MSSFREAPDQAKTTLLNVLSGFIPENERILTIEDAAELQLQQQHVLRLETKTANVDGSGETTVRDFGPQFIAHAPRPYCGGRVSRR